MKKLSWGGYVLGLAVALGCSGRQKIADEPNLHPALNMSVEWIKNKRDSIDMRVNFTAKEALHFDRNAVTLTFEGKQGNLREMAFNITMPAGSSQAKTLIYTFPKDVPKSGTATITIDPLYKGTEGDAKLAPYKRSLPINK